MTRDRVSVSERPQRPEDDVRYDQGHLYEPGDERCPVCEAHPLATRVDHLHVRVEACRSELGPADYCALVSFADRGDPAVKDCLPVVSDELDFTDGTSRVVQMDDLQYLVLVGVRQCGEDAQRVLHPFWMVVRLQPLNVCHVVWMYAPQTIPCVLDERHIVWEGVADRELIAPTAPAWFSPLAMTSCQTMLSKVARI